MSVANGDAHALHRQPVAVAEICPSQAREYMHQLASRTGAAEKRRTITLPG